MKKLIILLLILGLVSTSVFASSYKINASGKVKNPGGNVQQPVKTQTNLYNNYQAPKYIAQKQAAANAVGTIDIVMDYSGSMLNWINAAKTYMSVIVSQLPASTNIGFRVFGHDNGYNPYNPVVGAVKEVVQSKKGYKVKTGVSSFLGRTSSFCSATENMVKVSPYNVPALQAGMNRAQIGGSTPLTNALYQAVNQDFAGFAKNFKKKIILITDGGENCGGDPCSFAKDLVSQRNDIIIDVVLVSNNSKALKCLSDTTGGNFYNPVDVKSFVNVIDNSVNNITTPENIPETEPVQQRYEYVKD